MRARQMHRRHIIDVVAGDQQLHHRAREEGDLHVDVVVGAARLRARLAVPALDRAERLGKLPSAAFRCA
jgi:hypothetical protein